MKSLVVSLLKWLGALTVLSGIATAREINPHPRAIVKTESLLEWTFKAGTAGWTAAHDCAAANADGNMRIQITGTDPYLFGPAIEIDGPVVGRLRMKCSGGGAGQIFWSTAAAGDFSEDRSQHFPLTHDGEWHDYSVALAADGKITRLRLDPGEAPGVIEVERFELVRETRHPLEIVSLQARESEVSLRLTNHSAATVPFTMDGLTTSVGGYALAEVSRTAPGRAPFRAYEILLESPGLPPIHRTIRIVDTKASAKWLELKSGGLVLRAAEDGSGARIEREGQLVAVLSPLVSVEGAIPALTLTGREPALKWTGKGVSVRLSLENNEINAIVTSSNVCEGPVLRAYGSLQQGLFAGLEYLAAGEHSSSMLDIETDEHVRFAPDPLKVTMPLMAFVTDRATTAMTWRDYKLQPVYATPNFLDGATGHRASLRGHSIDCTVLVRQPAPLEDAILWTVKRRKLPPLPDRPRSRETEMEFCLKTLSGPPLKTADGWGHCAEPSWGRQPYADHASTVWRLSGQIPSLPQLTPNGSHIHNDAIYFVTGRAREWLEMRGAAVRGIIAAQQPDGSFRYDGKYRRGHFEDTASGYCAANAVQLLEFARFTGNATAREAGVNALEYMKRFHDPRGAQTWEVPLHTPDILASAYLIQAYVRGFEITGNTNYLERARAWAITGLPFVYQWGDRPIMAYATIAVFGATGWRAPNWMGLPVQWCGYDYAYALALLGPFDDTLDWGWIATGILRTAEQMQYPDGEFAGCEPDSFNLAAQQRNGPAINPCALVSLATVLEGRLDSLALSAGNDHRVVAPFPVFISGREAHVEAHEGVSYQVIIDGARIVSVNSQGTDIIPLTEK